MWNEVIKFVGGTVVLISAVAWLLRSLMVHFLSKDIEFFKQELRMQSEKELVSLKSKLEIENAKIHIKLSALQERRILLIEHIYGKLIALSNEAACFSVEPLFDNAEDIKEKANKFIDIYFEFYQFFEKHEIFLSEHIEKQIKSLHKLYFERAIAIKYKDGNEVQKAIEELRSNYEEIKRSNEKIRNALSREFRSLLGVDS